MTLVEAFKKTINSKCKYSTIIKRHGSAFGGFVNHNNELEIFLHKLTLDDLVADDYCFYLIPTGKKGQ